MKNTYIKFRRKKMGWIRNLFSRKPKEEVIVLEEVVEKSMYPESCDTARRKTEFLYKSQENLRNVHNMFVTWRDDGLLENTWAGLPQEIKDKYPYQNSIDPETWQRFHDEEFMPRSENLTNEICVQRAVFKKDSIRDALNVRGELSIGEI